MKPTSSPLTAPKASGTADLAEDCSWKQFRAEELYCDGLSVVEHEGIAYPAALPEIEYTFAMGELSPDLDIACYHRAMEAAKVLEQSHLLYPAFVTAAILSELQALLDAARANNALCAPNPIRRIDHRNWLKYGVQMMWNTFGGPYYKWMGTYHETNTRLRIIMGESDTLTQYFDRKLQERLGVREQMAATFGMRRFLSGARTAKRETDA